MNPEVIIRPTTHTASLITPHLSLPNKNGVNVMTQQSRDPATNAALNGPDVPLEEKQRELEGNASRDDKVGYILEEDVDDLGDLTQTEIYEGEIEAGVNPDLPTDPDRLDLLTERELRAGETDDVQEAIQEGLTYVPPTDPPTRPVTTQALQDTEVASGFGVTSLDEPYDADHHSDFITDDDEMSARVRDAIRADSSTTSYANRIRIVTRGGVVALQGVVDDLTDAENLLAVASYAEGVEEVLDRLDLRD